MLVLIIGYVSYIAIFGVEDSASLTVVQSLGDVIRVDSRGVGWVSVE